MARVDEFDAFYHATRRPLLHQTYALTGDAERAARAVEHAFAHAWSEWRKVRHLPDPAAWVRGEAWRVAGRAAPRRRRRPSRRFVGDPHVSGHPRTLEALRDLPDGQRRALVLHHLADLPVERIAREIGIAEATAASLLTRAEQRWAGDTTPVGTALADLVEDITGPRLTRAPSLRRSGERRHRHQTLAGLVTASALLVGGGLLIVNDDASPVRPASTAPQARPDGAAGEDAEDGAADGQAGAAASAATEMPTPAPEPFLLDDGSLLTASQMRRVSRPAREWSVVSTTDGTTGDSIYAPCQREPFADPDGNQAMLRHFRAQGGPRLAAVQVIEESRSERQGAAAFDTMEEWYARCSDDGVQLSETVAVKGLGDEARAFRLLDFGRRDTHVTVGLVRTGPITIAVVASTRGGTPVPASRVLDRAAVSVTRVCLPVSGSCSTRTAVRRSEPLPTEEHPGFLSAFDLPKVADVAAPWVGTDPARSRDNPAATPCERARFRRAQHPRTRVFVLPTAERVPRRFGLTETVGTFRDRAAAVRFVREANRSAQRCPDRELNAAEPRTRELPGDHRGRTWRFGFEVDDQREVHYRVALVRSGRRVALLSMSPSAAFDVTAPEFTRLAVRASQRLSESDDGRR